MKNFLFFALLSLSSKSFAHDFSSQLGNDISSTDYIYISCDNLADKIHVEISGNKSAGSPIISAQIFKDTKAKNTQRFELFLYSQIVFRPDIEINISIGKKDQFQSTNIEFV